VFTDLLEPGQKFTVVNGRRRLEKVYACWGRILARS